MPEFGIRNRLRLCGDFSPCGFKSHRPHKIMIKIRRFEPSDLEKVMEIEKTSFKNRNTWSREYFERIYQKYPKGFIVAENKEEIIGFTIGKPKNEMAEMISLAVAPAWRKKGIGTKLINFLIEHFKEKRLKEISLNVRTKNKIGIFFYQNLGFKIIKTIKNYYRNGEDAYLMKKEISGT